MLQQAAGRTRDRPLFFDSRSLQLDELRELPLSHGQQGVVLTLDPVSEARTELVKLSPGWKYRGISEGATLELFVLEGDISVEGEGLGSGAYIFLPQGSDDIQLATQEGATVLLFANPGMPLFPPPYGGRRTMRSWQEAWRETPKPGLQAHGSFHKSLRQPDFTEPFHGGPGGLLRLVTLMPGYADGRQHVHHDCFEEMLLLRGDMFMPERGLMGPGTFFANPQEYWHAPMVSLGGALMLVHTDAPSGPWGLRAYPNGVAMTEKYLDGTSWLNSSPHVDWEDMQQWQDSSSEYREWRESPLYGDWATVVGRGAAAAFRRDRETTHRPGMSGVETTVPADSAG